MARRYYHKTRSYAWLWWLLLTALLVYGGWRLYNRWFVFNPQAILEDAILKEKNFDTEVKEITSPKAKIKAYLFQDKTNPIISINFLFKNAGLSTDETQQSGISTMAAALLTEGAGNLDSQQFKEILEQKAVGMGFSADMDDFSGHLLTTRENMNTAFKMLNMAMTQPRFDEEDIRRTKAQMLAALKRQTEHPSGVLALEAAKEIFGKHPYARNPVGDAAAIAKIGRPQLLEFVRNHLSKSNLMVGIAGDVSEEEAGKIVDALFGSLPESGRIVFVREAEIDFDGHVKTSVCRRHRWFLLLRRKESDGLIPIFIRCLLPIIFSAVRD